MTQLTPTLQAGQPAPDFNLPAIHRDGEIALADYRGRSPFLLVEELQTVRTDLGGELPQELPIMEAFNAIGEKDPDPTPTDSEEREKQFPQLLGQFLVDREGVIRWANIEAAREGVAGIGKFPTDEEFLAAAARLSR